MTKILIVTGSVRPNSVNQKITAVVATELKNKGVDAAIADLKELDLPFFGAALPPSAEGYNNPNPAVQKFARLVADADGVVFVAPEYNHALSAVTKNALDSLYAEWQGKPAAFVGYSWYGAKYAYENFIAVNDVIKLNLGKTYTGLQFTKELNPDGTFADEAAAKAKITATLDELLAATI